MDVPSIAIADVFFLKMLRQWPPPELIECVIILKEWLAQLSVFLVPVSICYIFNTPFFIKILAGSKYYAAVPILADRYLI